MALILTLIFIVFFAGCACCRRLNTAARRQESITRKNEIHRFEQYVATKEKTEEIRKASMRDEACYLCGLPAESGKEDVRAMRKRIWNEVGIQPAFEMITCAILAQRGLVPYGMAYDSYHASIIEPVEELREVEHKFLKWLDSELKQHSMPYRIKFVPSGKYLLDAKSFETDNIPLGPGRYIWHPGQAIATMHLTTRAYDYKDPFVDYK